MFEAAVAAVARWAFQPAYFRIEFVLLLLFWLLFRIRPDRFAGDLRVPHPYLVLALLTIGLRLALLPLFPVPDPRVHDEFGYLLGADTFAHGRLTNPTHPMWRHMESMHIFHQPSYQSKYPPGQFILLAAGQLLGHPWIGVLGSTAAMAVAVAWAARAWLPANLAFVAGLLVALRLGVFNYWGNSYWGGTMAATGGALVLGAAGRGAHPWWFAAGAVILALRRPWEGLVFFLAVSLVFAARLTRTHLRAVAIAMVPVLAWLGYYNWRVTGDPLLWPYAHEARIYGAAPQFIFNSARPAPEYRHAELREQFAVFEVAHHRWRREHFLLSTATGYGVLWMFYLGPALTVAAFALPRLLRDAAARPLLIVGALGVAGTCLQTHLLPHYLAPFTAVVFIVVMQSLRALPAALARAAVGTCLVMALLVPVIRLSGWRMPATLRGWWSLPVEWSRDPVIDRLKSAGGRHLVLVRYSPSHPGEREWVYNAAGIDGAPIVWVRMPRPEEAAGLLRYFAGRRVWVLDADADPPGLAPYPN